MIDEWDSWREIRKILWQKNVDVQETLRDHGIMDGDLFDKIGEIIMTDFEYKFINTL